MTGYATGNFAKGIRPMMGQLGMANISTEILYSFIIVVCSLMIYFGTKELYKLSGHKGIKYFRLAFLFFAIAYFFRSFIKFLIIYFDVRDLFRIIPMNFGAITLFLFMFFSSLAIFYLLYSVMWKKWDKKFEKIWVFHLFALVIALISIFIPISSIYLLINLILLIFILTTLYYSYKHSRKKKNNLYVIYILLFIFWLLNIIDILVPNFLQYFQLTIYLVSSFIFLLILYKVIKNVGSN